MYKYKYAKYKSKYINSKNLIGGKTKYFYHGSPKKIKILKSFPSKVVNNDKVVFATNTKWLALFFMASNAKDSDIELGFIKGIPYILEQYEGAFDKFLKGKKGYLHYVNSKHFKSDKRVGMPNHEFISYKSVKVEKVEKINDIFKALEKEEVRLLYWKDKEKMLLNILRKKN